MPKARTLPKERADLNPEWIADEFELDGYDSRMSSSSTSGVSNLMRMYLKQRGLKTSLATTNAEKWSMIVRDCVKSELIYADPLHYHTIPLRFMTRGDFWAHHTIGKFKDHMKGGFLHFLLAGFLMITLHFYSYEFYTKPLPFHPIPCSKYPSQVHCQVLKKIQDYTYSGWDDLIKFAVHYLISMLSGSFFTALMTPFSA